MSKRDIRRLNKIAVERKLRKLSQEKDRLWDADKNLGWMELEEPIRDGWEKSLVLRQDIAARNDAPTYLRLLAIVNNTIVSKNKTFTHKNWRTKRIEVNHVTPKEFRDREFEKVPPDLYKFFSKVHRVETSRWGTYEYDVWIMNTPWVFEEKIKKHFITKVKIYDSEIDSRLKEIDNYIERNGLEYKYHRMKGWGNGQDEWDTVRRKIQDNISLKEMDQELKEENE